MPNIHTFKHARMPGKMQGTIACLAAGLALSFTSNLRAADPEIITPTGAEVIVGDILGGFEPVNLINGSGLSELVTLENYSTVTHRGPSWVTATARFPNYFTGGFPAPELVFTLDGTYSVTGLILWGYGGNNNEGTDFKVEFSTDNGVTFTDPVEVATEQLLGTTSALLDFTGARNANKVKITITNNGGGREFTGVGTGDRVGFGEIRFVGTNEGGPVSPPAIQQQPLASTVLQGSPASFTVIASGRGTLTYQWQKDQKDLTGQTSDSLQLAAATAADAGKYRVLVSNEAGTTPSIEVDLTVIVPKPGFELITPTGITQTAGDFLGGFAIENLINDSGLSETPTADNYPVVKHSEAGRWATSTAVFPDNYFVKGQVPPQFVLNLPGVYNISDLIIWGYAGNNNEASDFVVEFSTDGGTTFGPSFCTATTKLVANDSARLSLGTIHSADAVRITMVNNAGGRGFTGVGPGDRVGLGEIKFLAVLPTFITPQSIQLTAGDTLDGFPVEGLINGSGLSAIPTLDTYTTVTHGDGGRWVTATGTFPNNYFTSAATPPVLALNLGGLYALSDLVVWGYAGNNNEGTDFEVQFSTDNGATFGPATTVASSKLLANGVEALSFGTPQIANAVQIRIISNGGKRGFNGVGPGDRVGLGEIRFLGTSAPELLLPSLGVARSELGYVIQFCNGILETATDLNGPWTPVDGATSPYLFETIDAQRFFRAR